MRSYAVPCIAIFMALCSPTLATFQQRDHLIYQGTELYTQGIVLLEATDEASVPAIIKAGRTSTANYRGYVAHWSIRGDQLYIDRVTQEREPNPKRGEKGWQWRTIPLDAVRKGKTAPCVADWFTGIVRAGKEVDSDQATDEGHPYEEEFLFHIVQGKVKTTAKIKPKERDPFRLHADVIWCALGDEKKEREQDKGDWIDARLLTTKAGDAFIHSGKPVKTRGTGLLHEAKVLWVDSTDKANEAVVDLESLPDAIENSALSGRCDHVELTGTLRREGEKTIMKVSSIRVLRFGETMHAANFAEMHKKLGLLERKKVTE